ncbi:tRNA isopentenyl-2-thiomethyl-A-37 hydroxylase MiaE [Shewanella acanthi]|uniref:tRNA isopentenyl-2-thiomethyl-A-37 hydroxylase MiaE n=1 Tax=Shewanella acanthi TaxID=2864212 RepID=UPI001C65FDE0|nr:tRNA isopentenyl-2-thiomethyl-A-37 hydroxylase MiaE [Shewanella acanthi]QYJ77720.1 tRNA isopentenyl-2-thiomethyl-A-37 hydroxylase MiaE [Shewanella acanthi]
MQQLLAPVHAFLRCETPRTWIEAARDPSSLNELLIDHCNCELKAAQTAMFLLRRYALDKDSGQSLLTWAKPYEEFVYLKDRDIEQFLARDVKKNELVANLQPNPHFTYAQDLIPPLIRLIKEEFHHFEQVLELMHARNISYQNIRAGRYAKGMMGFVTTHEKHILRDKLIVGAYIEARSCERFAKLAPYLDAELSKFYVSLLRSEARHFEDYLKLAQLVSSEDISERVAYLGEREAELILAMDEEFHFHSGQPAIKEECMAQGLS